MEIFGKILDVVWPRTCAFPDCGRPADRPTGHVCARCWATLPWHDARDDAALAYLDPVPRLVQAFKFGHATHLAETFAEIVVTALRRKTDVSAIDLVVPVPLHPRRLRERGYNQSELVARRVAAAIGRACDAEALLRKRDTEHQARLSGEERRKNLRGAFAVDFPERVRGRTVLLVDDVATTGSTLAACREALEKSGAARVLPFAVAHAMMENDQPPKG